MLLVIPGSVIKGWDVGVATMKRGELAKFTLKAEYAYGTTGSPPKIPPDATLIFEIELFDWKGIYLSIAMTSNLVNYYFGTELYILSNDNSNKLRSEETSYMGLGARPYCQFTTWR